MPKRKSPKISVTPDGPYLVEGAVPLDEQTAVADRDGIPYQWKQTKKMTAGETYLLCRCGHSKNKPFCDQSHLQSDFDGQETADRVAYQDAADVIEGPYLTLQDSTRYCSRGRFCDRGEGVWSLTMNSKDPKKRAGAIEEACNCPSGRLVVSDPKTRKAIEPKFEPSISTTQDPSAEVSGPLWVKGNVEVVSAKGKPYEKRNRVTLCRCGQSGNKPFCDGTHIDIGFTDKK